MKQNIKKLDNVFKTIFAWTGVILVNASIINPDILLWLHKMLIYPI